MLSYTHLILKKVITVSVLLFVPGILIGHYSPHLALWYFIAIFLLEVGTYTLVNYLRKEFQWLITPSDFFPVIDKEGLAKFIDHGYDAELGWVRKANTRKEETGKQGKTQYLIDDRKRRSNPGHDTWPGIISCYGDSFVFCRQVNDNETFEWYLSEMTRTDVMNFGVGNYGLDQALLRLKREYQGNRTKIVVMGVVPSTIVRILCVWKHYNEFGNVFGFKPRFFIEDGQLVLIRNIIDGEDKFERYREFIPEINRHDEFYETKFKKDMIAFPYLASVISNPARNLPLLAMVARDRWFGENKNDQTYPPAMSLIMKSNLKLREQLFLRNKDAVDLLEKLVLNFALYGKENNFVPVFLWMPQKDDLISIKKNVNYYGPFINRIKEKLITIDLTSEIINREDLDDLYSEDNQYGGHFSKHGNLMIANIIYSRLISHNIFEKGEGLNG